MSIALAERPASNAVTAEQLELVRKTVAQGATDAELSLYLYDCQRHGVHPLDRLLHFTKRGGKYTPITSIDLMRMRAADTGECIGISDPEFADTAATHPAAATVTVKRLVRGHVAEFTATARWAEYYPGDQQGHMWRKMPHTMLGKCAEALALRKGFPKQLAGLYAREEMDQAERTEKPVMVVEPPIQTATNGEQVNAITGEVVPDDGQLRIKTVESRPTTTGKQRWLLAMSDGREIWTFREPLFSLAMNLCQSQTPVIVEAKDKGRWGWDLESLKADVPEVTPPAAEPAITADDIPF